MITSVVYGISEIARDRKSRVGYAENQIRRILMHGGNRRSFQRYLKHSVGYTESSNIPESDMPDTTVFIGRFLLHREAVVRVKFSPLILHPLLTSSQCRQLRDLPRLFKSGKKDNK